MVAEVKTWSVAEAKTQLSKVIDRALHDGPQTITRRGKDAVVVVSAEEWASKTRRKGTLAEFFQNSPLREEGFVIPERDLDWPRDIEL
ncbi:MAG: type II toxin-antitoxin system Phd/YefM family antitoxin [Thermomicrobiales bacterium]